MPAVSHDCGNCIYNSCSLLCLELPHGNSHTHTHTQLKYVATHHMSTGRRGDSFITCKNNDLNLAFGETSTKVKSNETKDLRHVLN